jgi:integral membrane sensor domain MASE1
MASTYALNFKRSERPIIQAVHNQTLTRRIGGGYLLQLAIVFVAYLIAGKLGQATANIRSSNLGPVWPAYGVALAAILLCGYRVWLGVAAAAFFVAFFSPVPHIAALGQAAGATVAAMTGAFLLHRIANFHSSLSRLSDVLSLIVLGGFSSSIVSASIGVSVLYATHVHAYSGLATAWLIYWLGDATGVLLVTPIALRFTDFLKLREQARMAELTILLLLVATTCLVVFTNLPVIPVKLDVMAFAVLPFIMWAAIRFGVGVTAFSILIVAAIATIETALGSGPFTSNTTFLNAVLLDVFFGILSVSGLSLAAVIAEREHAERERE